MPRTENIGSRSEPELEEEADDRRSGCGAEGERRDDAEVSAATTAERPEQVWLGGGARVAQHAVGRDDVSGDELIAGEPVRPGQIPDAAAQGQPADPDRGARTTG